MNIKQLTQYAIYNIKIYKPKLNDCLLDIKNPVQDLIAMRLAEAEQEVKNKKLKAKKWKTK